MLLVTARGIAAEVLKNIVLAGVGKVVVLDAQPVKAGAQDLASNFFLRHEDVEQGVLVRLSLPSFLHSSVCEAVERSDTRLVQRAEATASRAKSLNPRVAIESRSHDGAALLDDDAFLSSFDLIVRTEISAPDLVRAATHTLSLFLARSV